MTALVIISVILLLFLIRDQVEEYHRNKKIYKYLQEEKDKNDDGN